MKKKAKILISLPVLFFFVFSQAVAVPVPNSAVKNDEADNCSFGKSPFSNPAEANRPYMEKKELPQLIGQSLTVIRKVSDTVEQVADKTYESVREDKDKKENMNNDGDVGGRDIGVLRDKISEAKDVEERVENIDTGANEDGNVDGRDISVLRDKISEAKDVMEERAENIDTGANEDGNVDGRDIGVLRDKIRDIWERKEAVDLNGDGQITANDIDFLKDVSGEILQKIFDENPDLKYDFNGDGRVSDDDRVLLIDAESIMRDRIFAVDKDEKEEKAVADIVKRVSNEVESKVGDKKSVDKETINYDITGDGRVDVRDIRGYRRLLRRIMAYIGSDNNSRSDLNKDGKVDVRDIRKCYKIIKEIRALGKEYKEENDINKDGKIDARDVSIYYRVIRDIRKSIGKPVNRKNIKLDFTGDGIIDTQDIRTAYMKVREIKLNIGAMKYKPLIRGCMLPKKTKDGENKKKRILPIKKPISDKIKLLDYRRYGGKKRFFANEMNRGTIGSTDKASSLRASERNKAKKYDPRYDYNHDGVINNIDAELQADKHRKERYELRRAWNEKKFNNYYLKYDFDRNKTINEVDYHIQMRRQINERRHLRELMGTTVNRIKVAVTGRIDKNKYKIGRGISSIKGAYKQLSSDDEEKIKRYLHNIRK